MTRFRFVPLPFVALTAISLLLTPGNALAGFSLNADNWLVKDGTSFLPLGMYSVPDGTGYPSTINALPEMSGSLNIITNVFWAQGSTSAANFLTSADAHGLYGQIGFDEETYFPAGSVNVAGIRSYVNAVKTHENLVGYFQPDEPSTRGITPSMLEASYNAIKSADPSSLVFLDDYTNASIPSTYKNAYDVFTYDLYPIGSNGLSIQNFRTLFKQHVANASPKPVWGIVQAVFQPSPKWVEPTADEQRAMAYLMLAAGAKGLLSYAYNIPAATYGYLPDRPNNLANMKALFAELKSLSDIIVSTTEPSIAASTTSGIDFLMKNHVNQHYLFAVNYLSSNTHDGNWHYPGIDLPDVTVNLTGITSGTAKIIAGNSTGSILCIQNGEFVDNFPGYATKVYEVTASNIQAPTISDNSSTGTLPANTPSATMRVKTDEYATCVIQQRQTPPTHR